MKLTKTAVEAAMPGEHFDDEITGFCIRVTPSGRRTYYLKYQIGRGRGGRRVRWCRIGRHGDLTATQARAKAARLRTAIALGTDPQAERSGTVTVAQLADRYLEEYAIPHKAPRSVVEDRRNLAKHIVPMLGRMACHEVDRQAVAQLHHRMRRTPATANRVRALLSKMFGLAEEWKLREEGTNPVRGIKKFKETARERFLNADELRRLGRELDDAIRRGDHLTEIVVIKFLLLTGCRLSEALTLQWSWVDFERGAARLPTSKTGAKTLHLPAPALDLLADRSRDGQLVFAGPHGKPWDRSRIEKAWRVIRTRAGLGDSRLHDCRHTTASWAVLGGANLPLVGKLLGHRSVSTTAKYTHLESDPVHELSESVAAALNAALEGKSADIVNLPRRRRTR